MREYSHMVPTCALEGSWTTRSAGHGQAAFLQNHRLRFNKKSWKDGSGKANVEAYAGKGVWGVLYTIRDVDLQTLDAGEGEGYCRKKMRVSTGDGAPMEAGEDKDQQRDREKRELACHAR